MKIFVTVKCPACDGHSQYEMKQQAQVCYCKQDFCDASFVVKFRVVTEVLKIEGENYDALRGAEKD